MFAFTRRKRSCVKSDGEPNPWHRPDSSGGGDAGTVEIESRWFSVGNEASINSPCHCKCRRFRLSVENFEIPVISPLLRGLLAFRRIFLTNFHRKFTSRRWKYSIKVKLARLFYRYTINTDLYRIPKVSKTLEHLDSFDSVRREN